MPKNFVDTLLARADNSYAPVLISVFMVFEERFDAARAQEALTAMAAGIPALAYRFNGSWRRTENSTLNLITRNWPRDPEEQNEIIHELLREKLDLAREIPLRVGLFSSDTHSMVAMQLHHAAGDGRSLMYLIAAFFAMLGRRETRLPAAEHATNARLLKAGLSNPRSLASMFSRESAVLASRAARLKGHRGEIGRTSSSTLRFKKLVGENRRNAELLFIAALFAASARMAENREHDIRFRMPVDLRTELDMKNGVENFCSAISLEISPRKIEGLSAGRLMDLIQEQRLSLLRNRAHRAFLPKGWLLSKFASSEKLRRSMREDLMATPRSNTLVLTWMGNVAKCARPFSSRARRVVAHTPTWGAIGFTLRDELIINLNYFDGIWDAAYLNEFKKHVGDWLKRACGLELHEGD